MFIKEVEEGQKGRAKGLPIGLTKFAKFIKNIQKKTYYVLGAQQKTGKTALADDLFILGPFSINPKANVKWIYFSLEVDLIEKMAKYCAYFMDKKYKVYCDSNYILSRGDDTISSEHLEYVKEIYNNELKELFGEYDDNGKLIKEGKIIFYQDKIHPEGIRRYLLQYAEDNGEFKYEPYQTQDNAGKTVTMQRIISYKENDPDLYTIVIVDHVGLLKRQQGFTKKENIDKLSEHFVYFRNLCKFSPVAISQFNRELGKVDRLKFSGEQLQPSVEDFKDTGSLAEDASIVLALFNPTLLPHIKEHRGYDVTKIGKSYRSLHILSSRNTVSGVGLSLILEGKTGKFIELPKSDDTIGLEKVYNYTNNKLG